MPGRGVTSPADFDAQFNELLTKVNSRVVRTITRDLADYDRAFGLVDGGLSDGSAGDVDGEEVA